MFSTGSYATIWGVEDKGNYSVVNMSTSKKNQKTEKYETDFQSKFVRFIGSAHNDASKLKEKDRIKIGNCGVSNFYNKETKKEYTNFCVFSFESVNGKPSTKETEPSTKLDEAIDDTDNLPFE